MASASLDKYIDKFAGKSVAVLGDVMLDRYYWGTATRISQEAPVPVVRVDRENSVPGGAANVARNIVSAGGRAQAFGLVGKDAEGEALKALLKKSGVQTEGLLEDAKRPTTVKTRLLASNQQVVRIDRENTDTMPRSLKNSLVSELEQKLAKGDIHAIILEDYAKGVFSKELMEAVVALAHQYGVITGLDPHPHNSFHVKGLTLMTPNRNEAFQLAGMTPVPGGKLPCEDQALLKAGQIIHRLWAPEYLLVTLGADGMALFTGDDPVPQHIPTKAQQVFDVSGAGDTVMATMMLALLAGASPMDAARIANYAAGVVVGIVGTAAIEREALRAALTRQD